MCVIDFCRKFTFTDIFGFSCGWLKIRENKREKGAEWEWESQFAPMQVEEIIEVNAGERDECDEEERFCQTFSYIDFKNGIKKDR